MKLSTKRNGFLLGILGGISLMMIGRMNNVLTNGDYAHGFSAFLILIWIAGAGSIWIGLEDAKGDKSK